MLQLGRTFAMMKYFLYLSGILTIIYSCQNPSINKHVDQEQWIKDSLSMVKQFAPSDSADHILHVIMPLIGRKHDSIPFEQRFEQKYQSYYNLHKTERQYQIIYQHRTAAGQDIIMVKRLEPSIKNDKFSVLCAQYKHLPNGSVDTASFEELFWTWKMPLTELHPKAAKLFKAVVNHEDLKPFIPGKEDDLYIMFPDDKVTYDRSSKTWVTKDSTRQ